MNKFNIIDAFKIEDILIHYQRVTELSSSSQGGKDIQELRERFHRFILECCEKGIDMFESEEVKND